METNGLIYNVEKIYIENGTTFKMKVNIRLNDECKNNICEWTITADIYEKQGDGRYVYCCDGCCHEEILKHFPQFKRFVDLHFSNHYGQPPYPVKGGGFYYIKQKDEKAINYLRITENEYNMLCNAEDEQYFTYLLHELGIVERWKRESDEAIKVLEELTGQTWVNPYKPEEERLVLKFTDEERTLIKNRLKEGYYTPEAIQARKEREKREKYEKKRNEIIADCEKAMQKAENKKLVMLAVLDAGISLVYYDSSNEFVFNWRNSETKITQEELDNFVKTVDKTKLPKDITFRL